MKPKGSNIVEDANITTLYTDFNYRQFMFIRKNKPTGDVKHY